MLQKVAVKSVFTEFWLVVWRDMVLYILCDIEKCVTLSVNISVYFYIFLYYHSLLGSLWSHAQLSVSVAIFPGGPGLAGNYTEPKEVMLTTGAIRQANSSQIVHHQQTNIQFSYRLDVLPVTQPTVLKHWRDRSHAHMQICTNI